MATTIVPMTRKWRERVLLAVVIATPVIFLPSSYSAFGVPKLVVVLVGVVIAAAMYAAEIAHGASTRVVRVVWVPFAAVAVPLVVAWAFSPYRGWALFGSYSRLNGLIPYLAVVVLGLLIADAFAGKPLPVIWGLVGAGAAVGLYAVVQSLGWDPFSWTLKGSSTDQVASTLGNSNFAGGFLGICLPMAICLAVSDRERRAWVWAGAAVIAAGCAVAGAAGGWAAASAGAAVVGGVILQGRVRWTRVAGFVAAGLIALAAAGAVIAGMADIDVPATVDRRAQWWEAALGMSAANPILGHGPASFAIDHARYRTPEDAATVSLDITDDPHSVPLSFLTSAGVLGLAGLVVAIGWVVRRWRENRSDSEPPDLMRVAFLGALVAYSVQALVSIDTVALRTTAWACLGGFICTLHRAPEEKRRSQSRKGRRTQASSAVPALRGNVVLVVAAILAALGVFGSIGLLRADMAVSDATEAVSDGDFATAQASFRDAIDRREEITYKRIYGRLLGDVAVAAGEEDGKEVIREAREVFSFVDSLPHLNSMVDLARILDDWSEVEPSAASDAVDLYARAAAIDKYDAFLLEEASDAALRNEDYEVAAKMLAPTAERVDYVNVWANLAYAHAQTGDLSAAEEEANRALEVDPDQPRALLALEIVGDR